MRVVVFLFTYLLVSIQKAIASHVRRRNGEAAFQSATFECTITEVDGITAPNDEPVSPELICIRMRSKQSSEKTYRLAGDYEPFFEDVDISHGGVRIRVPLWAVERGNIIIFDQESFNQITVTYDLDRKLNTGVINYSNVVGTKKILIIRLSNDSVDAHKISQTEDKLMNDFFWDSNNLKKVYWRCSRRKLEFIPATPNAVITIVPPSDVCGMKWREAGDYAIDELQNQFEYIDRSHTLIVMPNCVDFEGAAAWAESPGSKSWYRSLYASLPLVQVHEIGHNLGAKHSGKNGVRYADDTGYMGNQGMWTDEGNKMCFNAAKIWVFGWYSEFHKTSNPEKTAFIGNLVGISDAKNSPNAVTNNGFHVIVRLKSDSSRLFMVYNRKAGLNAEVADGNKLVIIDQDGRYTESTWKAALDVGESYIHKNWNGGSRNLIIVNCGLQNEGVLESMFAIAYLEGLTSAQCNNGQTFNTAPLPDLNPGCDLTEVWWHDVDGEEYNCEWYSQSNRCAAYGDQFENDGYTANEACCACED